jgi:hypothetical protein
MSLLMPVTNKPRRRHTPFNSGTVKLKYNEFKWSSTCVSVSVVLGVDEPPRCRAPVVAGPGTTTVDVAACVFETHRVKCACASQPQQQPQTSKVKITEVKINNIVGLLNPSSVVFSMTAIAPACAPATATKLKPVCGMLMVPMEYGDVSTSHGHWVRCGTGLGSQDGCGNVKRESHGFVG